MRRVAQSRAALLLLAGGTGSSSAVTVPGRGEYGKTCTFVRPAARTVASVVANARSSSAGKPTITSLVRLNSSCSGASGAGTSRPCSGGPSRAARRRRPIAGGRAGGGSPSASRAAPAISASSTWLISIDERRRRSSPGVSPAARTSLRQVEACGAVAVAAEVDAGEHDLAMSLPHPPARSRRAPPRPFGCAMRRARAG